MAAMRTHPPSPPSRCFTLALILSCLTSATALSFPHEPASASPFRSTGVLSCVGARPLQGGILRLRGGATDATAQVGQDPCRPDHLRIEDLGNGCHHRNCAWDCKRFPLHHHRHKHDRIPPQSNTIPGRQIRRSTPSPRSTGFPHRRATSSPPQPLPQAPPSMLGRTLRGILGENIGGLVGNVMGMGGASSSTSSRVAVLRAEMKGKLTGGARALSRADSV